jgi:hypothetical protein
MTGVEPKYMPNGSGRDGFIFMNARRYKSESKLGYLPRTGSGKVF